MAINESALAKSLFEANEWWLQGCVSQEKSLPFKRRDYYKIREELKQQPVTAIIGPRQVGKTTIMHQLIQSLIFDEKVEPKRILYAQIDSLLNKPGLRELRIEDLLETYATNTLKEPLNKLTERTYVFLDEIQKLTDWNQQLKSLYDLERKMKFVLSGSSSNNILVGSAEALTGRLSINIVMPMKFVDVLTANKKELRENLIKPGLDLRAHFSQAIVNRDPEKFFEELKKTSSELLPHADTIQIALDHYLLLGGYPATLKEEGFTAMAKILNDYAYLSIFKDVITLFGIRNSEEINQLLNLVAAESPDTESYESIGVALKLDSVTVKKYLSYLEMAFLISQASVYTRNVRKRQKSLKKIYLNDTGLRNAILGILSKNLFNQPEEMGKLAEMVLYNHLKRLKFNLEKTPAPRVDYWKNAREVDNVVTLFNQPIPIESKYKNEPTERDVKGLREFQLAHNPPFGLLITKNTLKKEENILFVPLWLFLLMC